MSKLDIPQSWAKAKLGDFLKIKRGASPRPVGDPKYFGKSGCGWLKISDLTRQGKYISEAKEFVTQAGLEKSVYVPPGDLVLSNSATIGLPAITKYPFCVHDGFLTFPNLPSGIDIDFFYNFFLAFRTTLQSKSIKGATQANLNLEIVSKIEMPIPPLGEQKRIVAKIESTFSKIKNIESNLEQAEKLLEKYRESLLSKAFRGELIPQNPSDEPASELLKRIRAEREKDPNNKKKKTDSLPPIADDEIPFEIPKSWEWVRWGDLVTNDDGFKRGPFGSSITKSMFVKNSPYKIYEQYCPINDDCSYARYFITEQKFKEMESFAVKSNDLLISCSGVTLGRITEVPLVFDKGIINQAILRIRLENRLIISKYFISFFRSDYFQNKIFEFAPGSAQPNMVGVKILKNLLVPVPPIEEQDRLIKNLALKDDNLNLIKGTYLELKRKHKLVLSSVLNSAFSGSLVPQVPKEGTGHELLSKIKIQTETQSKVQETNPKKKRVK